MVCEWNLRKYFLPSASKVHHNMYIKMPTSCMTSFKNFNLLYKCDDTTMPRSVARSTKLPQEKTFMLKPSKYTLGYKIGLNKHLIGKGLSKNEYST